MLKSNKGDGHKFIFAFLSGSILAVARLLTGLARTKYIAITMGTAGVGLLAMGNQLTLFGVSVGSLGLAVGVIRKLVSKEYAAGTLRRRELLATAFTVQLVISLAIVLLGLMFPATASKLVFGSANQSTNTLIVLLGIPFSVLASSHVEAILNGCNGFDLYVIASTAATVLGTLAFFPLAHAYGVRGAFLSITVNAVLYFILFVAVGRRRINLRDMFRIGFKWRELRDLLKVGFVMLTTGVLNYGAAILIRRQLLITLGAAANGIVQVPLALTAYYTPFLTNALWGHLHPYVGEKGDSAASLSALATALRVNMVLSTCIVTTVLLIKGILVRVAYSSSFLMSIELMPLQFFSDFFYFIALAFSVYFLGTHRLRIYLTGWTTYFGLMIAASLILMPSLGTKAIPAGYLFASLMLAIPALVWFRRAGRVKGVQADTWLTFRLFWPCLSAIAAQCLLAHYRATMVLLTPIPLGCISITLILTLRRNPKLIKDYLNRSAFLKKFAALIP